MFELRIKRIKTLDNEIKSLLGVSMRQVNNSVSLESDIHNELVLKNSAFHRYINDHTKTIIDKITHWLDKYSIDRFDVLEQAGRNIAYALTPEPEEFIDSNGKHYIDEKTLEQLRYPVKLNYKQLFDLSEGLRKTDISEDETPFEMMVDFKNIATVLTKSERFLKVGALFTQDKEATKKLAKLLRLTAEAENCIDEDFEKLKQLAFKLIEVIKNKETIPLSDKPNLDEEEMKVLDISFSSNTLKTIESTWFGNVGKQALSGIGTNIEHVLKDPLLLFKPNNNTGEKEGLSFLVYNSTVADNIKAFKSIRMQISNVLSKWHEYNRVLDRIINSMVELLSSNTDDYNNQIAIDILFLLNQWNEMIAKIMEFYYLLLVNIEQNIIYIDNLAKVLLNHKTIVQQYIEKRSGK